MFHLYCTAHYADHCVECPADSFETRQDALDSLPAGAACIGTDSWRYAGRPGDGDGEHQLHSYVFALVKD